MASGWAVTEPDQLRQVTVIASSQKCLPLAAIGWRFTHNTAARHQQQRVEALAQLASLAVAHEDRVAERQTLTALIAHRRLHLARALERQQRGAGRQVWEGQLLGPRA